MGVSYWTILWMLLSVSLGMPCITPCLESSVTASVFWMIQCDPRDPWNCHMIPTMGDGIWVWGNGSVLQWWMVSLSFESSHPNFPCLYPSWNFLIRPSSYVAKLILHSGGIFSWGPISPVSLGVWFSFILVFNCSPTFCILGFHCLSQFYILASQLFHIS